MVASITRIQSPLNSFLNQVLICYNCATFSNHLLTIFMSWFCPAFWWRDSNELDENNLKGPLWGIPESLSLSLPLVTQSHYFSNLSNFSKRLVWGPLFFHPFPYSYSFIHYSHSLTRPMSIPPFSKFDLTFCYKERGSTFLRIVGKLHSQLQGSHTTRLLRKHTSFNSHLRHTGYNL
jgi:hypothetical protein